jgi:hypothetical protein
LRRSGRKEIDLEKDDIVALRVVLFAATTIQKFAVSAESASAKGTSAATGNGSMIILTHT